MAKLESCSSEIAEIKIDGVTQYTSGDINIYRIPVENFPNSFTNDYLILDREASLVDVGFDGEKSRADLERGFEIINKKFNKSVGLESVNHIVITHGHIDHCGMLSYPQLKGRRLYIHEFDTGIVENFDEESSCWMEQMTRLVMEAGWDICLEGAFFTTQFTVEPGDYDLIRLKDGDEIINGYKVCHIPGHAPGMICLEVGNLVFLGDHMLSSTTPHQSPKSHGGAGLQAYLESLKKVARRDARLGLPAHGDTIYTVKERVAELGKFHQQRLDELAEMCQIEKSLGQLTTEYYGRHPELMMSASNKGFSEESNWILALDEIAAHVEYLLEHNRIEIAGADHRVIRYRSTS